MSDEYAWLETPIHRNNFKSELFEDESIIENLKLSFDGSIMAVRRKLVEKDYEEQDVKMMALGYKQVPKTLKVKDAESFYKFLALHVNLED